jgi:uncharacterized protein YecE (DUF72 family)
MEFGKVPHVERVDFSLPPVPARTQSLLKELARGAPSPSRKVWVGAPAWSHKEWAGKVYPKKAPASDYLALYSRQFGTIELNMTHYRTPDAPTVRKWRETTDEDFRFCPKFPQLVSHDLALRGAELPTRHFVESVSGLGPKLGLPFLQLGPAFTPRELPDLSRFLLGLGGFPVAVEFRHASWFRSGELLPAAADLLVRAGASTVITDVAGRRDVSHGTLTSRRTMVRFIGNALHPTDYSRADAWIARLGEWFELGLDEIFLMVHEPEDLLTPEMIAYFVENLNARLGAGAKLWRPEPPEPMQLGLF